MKTEELNQIALTAAKNIKTEQDLTEFQQMLTKVTVEAALNIEVNSEPTTRPRKSFTWRLRKRWKNGLCQSEIGNWRSIVL